MDAAPWLQKFHTLPFLKESFVPPLGTKARADFCRGKISKIFVCWLGFGGVKCQWTSDDFSTDFRNLGYKFQQHLRGANPKSIKVKQKGRMKGIAIFSPFNSHPSHEKQHLCTVGGGFKYFLFFTPIWGRIPFWLIFFNCSWICWRCFVFVNFLSWSNRHIFHHHFLGEIFVWFTFSRNRGVPNPKWFFKSPGTHLRGDEFASWCFGLWPGRRHFTWSCSGTEFNADDQRFLHRRGGGEHCRDTQKGEPKERLETCKQ